MARVVKPPHGSRCDAYLPGRASVQRCGNAATQVVHHGGFPPELFLCDECAHAILSTAIQQAIVNGQFDIDENDIEIDVARELN